MKSPNRWCKGIVSCRSFCMRFTVVYSGRSRLGLSPCAWFMWHTKRVCNSRISFVTLWRSVQIKGLISSSALAAHHGFSPNKAELRFQPTTAKSPRKDAPSFRTLKITEEADATPTHCPQFPSQLVMGDVHHERVMNRFFFIFINGDEILSCVYLLHQCIFTSVGVAAMNCNFRNTVLNLLQTRKHTHN